MKMIGFHASHELYTPRQLLDAVVMAENAGFECAMCSDHFRPWKQDGQSGYAFSWLAAALQATNLSFGSVHAPGQRYHPAISAQAIATLGEMFPERYWVALGSGQNLNESVTGGRWPGKPERNERLRDCAIAIQNLLRGERVTKSGRVVIDDAYLYTRPETPPAVYGAAISDETCAFVGGWAEGLVTVEGKPEEVQRKIEAFRNGGGEGKPVFMQSAIGYARTEKEAIEAVKRNWPVATLNCTELEDIELPEEMESLAKTRDASKVTKCIRISADLDLHCKWIEDDFKAGIERSYLHYLGDDLPNFIKLFGKEVLAKVKR